MVEGPIGAGKTSLARRLAARLSAELLLEDPGENPFLARFYQDMARFALPTQLFFLFQRARMLEPLAQPDMFGRGTIADFLLDKDPLFARITLSGDELALYEKIYAALAPRAARARPGGVLHAQPAVLVERVRRRGGLRARHQREYLALLAESYARFFYHYAAATAPDRQLGKPQFRRARRRFRAAAQADACHEEPARIFQPGLGPIHWPHDGQQVLAAFRAHASRGLVTLAHVIYGRTLQRPDRLLSPAMG